MGGLTVWATEIPGCLELQLPCAEDERGRLVKPFQRSVFADAGLPADFVEQFYSRSRAGVLRGLHFQTPPRGLAKLVTCVAGDAWDVVLDLRAGSPAYGRHVEVGLSAARANAILIPEGCAHGFLAGDDAVLAYWVTAEHSPDHDAGVRWDSAGIPWPLDGAPTVSARDAALPALSDFTTPFRYAP